MSQCCYVVDDLDRDGDYRGRSNQILSLKDGQSAVILTTLFLTQLRMEMEEFIVLAKPFAQNHAVLVMAWVLLFVTVIYTFIKDATSKVKVVNNLQATSLINNENAILVDIRSADEFKQGHIVNSLNLSAADIKKQILGKIEQYKEKPVIVVCASGVNSSASADLLSKQGFTQVYTLKDGIAAWRAANLPLVKK